MSKFKCGFKDAFITCMDRTKPYDTEYHGGKELIDRRLIDVMLTQNKIPYHITNRSNNLPHSERNFSSLNDAEKFVCEYFLCILSIAEKILEKPAVQYLVHDSVYELTDLFEINLYQVMMGMYRNKFDDDDIQIIKDLMVHVVDSLYDIDKSTHYAVLCGIYYIYILRGGEALAYEDRYIQMDDQNCAMTNLPLIKNAIYLKSKRDELNELHQTIMMNLDKTYKSNMFYQASEKIIEDAKNLNKQSPGFYEFDDEQMNMRVNGPNVQLETFENYHQVSLAFEFGSNVEIDFRNPDRLIAPEVMPFAFQEDCQDNNNFINCMNLIKRTNVILKGCRLINEAPIGTELTNKADILSGANGSEVYLSIDEYISDIKRFEILVINDCENMCENIYQSTLEILVHYK